MWNGLATAVQAPGAADAPDAVLPLRARVAATAWRRRLAARRAVDRAYRTSVAVIGGVIVGIGLITVPLPGPGWLTVLVGLFVLSSEFASAARLLAFTEGQVQRWVRWLAAQSVAVRLGLAAGSALVAYLVLVLTLRLVGVPGWLPAGVPLLG